jgi:hypothetical protein
MGWNKSAPCGASDSAEVRAGFLKNEEQWIHGDPIANHPANADKSQKSFSGYPILKAKRLPRERESLGCT